MAIIINFQEAKQQLELVNLTHRLKQEQGIEKPHIPSKAPLIISALPGEAIPAEYPDLRPLLQRDGLILLSWAKWNNHKDYGLCYRVNWIKSSGKARRYASTFLSKVEDLKELEKAMPDTGGDILHRDGIMGSKYWSRDTPEQNMADFVFLAAPDLNFVLIPPFIQKLKEAGITVNFDYEFSIGKAKELAFKKEAEKIEALNVSKTISPHSCVWGNTAGL